MRVRGGGRSGMAGSRRPGRLGPVIAGGDRTEPSRRDLEAARLELLRRRVWWFRVALAVVLIAGVLFAWLVATRWQGRVLRRPEILGDRAGGGVR